MTPGIGQIGLIPHPGNFMAKAICWATDSPVFHSILVVDDGGLCVEANPGGVQYCHVNDWPDAIYSEFQLTDGEAQTVAAFGISRLGRPYNYTADALLGFHERLGLPIPHWVRRRYASDRSYECAQLCASALSAADQHMFPQDSYNLVSPGDIYRYFVAAGWLTKALTHT